MKYYYINLLIISVLFSCGNHTSEKKNNKLETIHIDVNSSLPSVDFSNLIDSIKYVKLATDDNCLLRKIKKVLIIDNELFIFDNTLYVFGLDGKFKRKIGEKGKGPGELLTPFDFIYDKKSDNIEIFDFNGGKIKVFSRKGDFKFEKQFPFGGINRFEKLGNNYIATKSINGQKKEKNGALGYRIQIGNMENGFSQHKPLFLYDSNYVINQTFTKNRDKIFYLEALNDTIYEIDSTKHFSSRYYIDFGKNKMPKKISDLPLYDRFIALKDDFTTATRIDNFYVTPRFKYFSYLHNKKKENVLIVNDVIKIGEKITINDIEYSDFSFYNGSNIIASIEYPDSISKTLKKKISAPMNISDNPILTLFYLK